MSAWIVVHCDLCGAEQGLKVSAPISEAEYAEQLRVHGWWYRPGDGVRDVCGAHPHPLGGAA